MVEFDKFDNLLEKNIDLKVNCYFSRAKLINLNGKYILDPPESSWKKYCICKKP